MGDAIWERGYYPKTTGHCAAFFRGEEVSHTSPIAGARIREKSEFLKADDPGRALLDFFGRLGAKVRTDPRPELRVKSRPLILISQLPRSGGSLLCQLFDGHPQLLVYPWEMSIGYPAKINWPTLDPRAAPDHLFATLFHTDLAYLAKKGYRKSGKAKRAQKRLKFDYSPVEHYENFVRLLAREPTQRTVLDTYFSALLSGVAARGQQRDLCRGLRAEARDASRRASPASSRTIPTAD